MSRRNLKSDFEDMYLRYNMIKKHIKKADKTIVDDPQFKKCIQYLTNKYFYKNKAFFISNGFEIEDIHNVILVFGLTFWGHSKPPARDQKAFTFMMRYIGQRMQTMIRWISKKFGSEEIVAVVKFEDYYSGITSDDQDNSGPDLEQISVENILTGDEPHKRGSVNVNKDLLKAERKIARKEITEENRNQRAITKLLKDKLESNPLAYSDQLCYYATSKCTSKDIRYKARFVCKKYGIDYMGWLKTKMSSPDFNPSQYTF